MTIETESPKLSESYDLVEASFQPDGSTLTLTIIKPGFNSSKKRFYTEAGLKESAPVFKGLKMYMNHPTASQQRERPEGDIREWVASITESVWDDNNKAVRATAKIVDPQFLAKATLLDKQGLLQNLGVSIRALGEGQMTDIEGVRTLRVDRIVVGESVDFVTEPGAGGFVEFRESKEPSGDNTVTAEALAAAEVRAATAEAKVTSLEAQLAETKASLAVSESAIATMKATESAAKAQVAITQLIAESKLPEPSMAHLREALANESDVDKAKAAIASHAQLVEKLAESGKVRGLGESSSGGGSNGGGGSKTSETTVANFQRLGLSEAEAKIAAGVKV